MTLVFVEFIISLMKKYILTIILILTTVLTLFACSSASSNYATFTCTQDGTKYVLTVDTKNSSFEMNINDDSGLTYLGSCVMKNGYLVLESSVKGTQYAKINGDAFEFFFPDDSEDNSGSSSVGCKHDYVKTSSFDGNCSSRGYTLSICSLCNAEKKEFAAYGAHEYEFLKVITKGTCNVKEVSEYACKYCDNRKKITADTYADHTYGTPVIVNNDCRIKAQSIKKCTVCNHEEKSTLSYYGNHQFSNGICSVCSSRENGIIHGATHPDVNKNGVCDTCYTPLSVLEDMDNKGYSLTDDGYVYFGMYPQLLAKYSAEKIINNGSYDSNTDRYVYLGETYVISKAGISNLPALTGGTKPGTLPEKGLNYAFVLSPIKWKITSVNSNNYSLVCTSVLDVSQYLHNIKYFYNSETNKYCHTQDKSANANLFSLSDIKKFTDTFKNVAFSNADEEFINSLSLPVKTNVFTYEEFPTFTDYAIIQSSSLTFNKFYSGLPADEPVSDGTKTNKAYAIMVSNDKITDSGDEILLDKTVILTEVDISEKLGFLPYINVNFSIND